MTEQKQEQDRIWYRCPKCGQNICKSSSNAWSKEVFINCKKCRQEIEIRIGEGNGHKVNKKYYILFTLGELIYLLRSNLIMKAFEPLAFNNKEEAEKEILEYRNRLLEDGIPTKREQFEIFSTEDLI